MCIRDSSGGIYWKYMEQLTLQQHIEARVRAGATRDVIKEQVLAVGWSEEVVDKAYADALVASGVPVPTAGVRGTQNRASTLDIVINFFSFILLGITATALGTVSYTHLDVYKRQLVFLLVFSICVPTLSSQKWTYVTVQNCRLHAKYFFQVRRNSW